MSAIEKIAVVGAGLMGHGIAQVFASAGYQVAIADRTASTLASVRDRIKANLRDLALDESAVARVTPVADLREALADADFVVEAAAENLAVKQDLFQRIEAMAPSHAILASNTSVIPITQIMERLARRENCLGTHWWNPPYLIPLVEVIGTQWTSAQTIDRTMALHRQIGKTPVHVKRDIPGFIGNRLQHALWREAISLVENGICDAEAVDLVVKSSFGRRLAVLGPLENADLVGADLTLAVHQIVLPAIESRAAPSPYLERLVADKRLGMKSGEGFRTWTKAQIDALRLKVLQHLKAALARDGSVE
jgi:3-hydroxybutyryl-CoA dehydrogenase